MTSPSILTLYWHLLGYKAKLPDELILKILLQFNGLQHPLVKLLLNASKKENWEQLQALPFSQCIKRHYIKHGVDDQLIKIMNNKQTYYFIHNSASYLHHTDPGLFIPRQFGRLYYQVLFDNLKVEEFSYKLFLLCPFNSPLSRE
jgi:hypothetical protein